MDFEHHHPAGALRLHPRDDVLVSETGLVRGTIVETEIGPTELSCDIDPGHKIAYRSREVGQPVHRYGQVIGTASAPIRAGDHVHMHNLVCERSPEQGEVEAKSEPVAHQAPGLERSFDGYLRPGGGVGTRNYVAIISTVNCSASVARFASERFRDVERDHRNVDGVIALTHKSGCGKAAGGEDLELLQRVLAGYASHPNVAAYVIVGLGCEVNQAQALLERHRSVLSRTEPPVVLIQQEGGTRKAVEAVVSHVASLLPRAGEARRTRRPVSDLVLATNCGGSDGFSGITANPALGWAADELIRHGGTALLSETTEIFGAEQLLTRRARDPEVAQRLLDRIDWWRRHLAASGADLDDNPSPGNLAGGITTILEKSLGGVSKGGTTPLVDVIRYGERISKKGLLFMDTPAYDPVSVTGLVAGGANLICFTTGRGSVFGSKPVPSLKLATTSTLFRQMEEDMDLDCGIVLDGVSIEEMGRRIFEQLVETASGKRTKSEILGVGEEEFAPWQPGPTL